MGGYFLLFSDIFLKYILPSSIVVLIIVIAVVYSKKPVINGRWSDYTSNDTKCDVECGLGTFTETRTCNNPEPSNGGLACVGEPSRKIPCIGSKPNCPVDGGWTDWNKITDCGAECGDGTFTELRTCTNPAPSFGGKDCQGDTLRMMGCKKKECAIDGTWTDWDVGTCDPAKPGMMIQTRTCIPPQFGGKECVGDSKRYTVDGECTIDGGWSEWNNTVCSAECGGGNIMQERLCNNPVPQGGGAVCVGQSQRQSNIKCNDQSCPLTRTECNAITNGPYAKECLLTWFNDVNCTNDSYVHNYPTKYDGIKGWWHSQKPQVVKQDMRNWSMNPLWGNRYKNLCMPKNFTPNLNTQV